MDFLAAGICDARPLEQAGEHLEAWLEGGLHGSMLWMARTRKQRPDPKAFFPEAQSILVVADNYYRDDEPLERPPDQAGISLYARGRDYHKVLRKKLHRLLKELQALNPAIKGRVCVDSFPLMEKPLAQKAGLGWIGKHTNLIIKGKGSYFFLGEILLSVALPPSQPLTAEYCGTCTRCMEACPTNALEVPYQLDARRCISYLTIEHDGAIAADLSSDMGNWVFGCDICQMVCPWNRFSQPASEADYRNRIPDAFYQLEQLARMSQETFDRVFQGTPVRRAGYHNFMRNVAIARKNARRSLKPAPQFGQTE
ncbi:MAG: tRNA epoxyqueuosine(34) reductase QueG [Calditrichaeota bacterium]|nr:MAG: tRNA epoxyqueuosine(34) reductase QueG [Calditrichota bacterium]